MEKYLKTSTNPENKNHNLLIMDVIYSYIFFVKVFFKH